MAELTPNFGSNSSFDPVKATSGGGRDRILPKARLISSNINAKGATTFDFKVLYTDNLGIRTLSVNSRNLVVTGPNGFRQIARLVGKPRFNKKGTRGVATYRIVAPGGNWDFTDNGQYTISMLRRRVSDKSRNFLKPGRLGRGFLVNVPNESPTATFGSGNVTTSNYTFTVTYSDDTAVNAASLDSNDIRVTGPGGFDQLAQLVSVSPAGNGTPLTATYQITAPNGVWTVANDGTYSITMVSNQVSDTFGAPVAPTTIRNFAIEAGKIPPSARLTGGGDIANSGASTYDFTVTYSDNEAVSVATLGNGDVRVTGPNGFSQLATLVTVDSNSNGTPRIATYRITAPGGTWDGPDAGTYTVAIEPNQVTDLLGNITPGSNIGTFGVTIENTPPTATLAGAPTFNLDSGAAYITIAFSDNAGVIAASLNSLNVQVTGPNGYNQTATFVRVNPSSNGTALTATYRIDAPGGSWDGNALKDGTYNVSLSANQVSDVNNNVTPQTAIGSFQVLLKPFRLEAETFQLNNYVVESVPGIASNNGIIRVNGLTGQDVTGTATTTFNGPTGVYDLVIGYFDENDGVSEVTILVNGTAVPKGTWQFNKNFDTDSVNAKSFTRYSISGVEIPAGATITIQGKQVAPGTTSTKEVARVDYIDIIPLSNTSSPANASPGVILGSSGDNTVSGNGSVNTVDYTQLAKGIIADLSKNVVFKPIYGALKIPKIMALGDSITMGEHSQTPTYPGGYRIQLQDRFDADGLDLDFVGSQNQSSVSALNGDTQHESYTGINNTLQELKNVVVASGAFPTGNPDVVLFFAGTGNTGNSSLDFMKAEFELLLNSILTKLSPNAHLLVGSIPPSNTADPVRNQRTADFNALIPGIVGNFAAAGKNVSFVDINSVLTTSDLISGGVHLSAAGHNKVGDKWYDALIDKDTLTGIQNIVGTGFADTIVGNGSANVIEGGRGADTLTGGASGDTFVYRNPNEGGDTITDFGPSDVIQVSASGFGGGLVSGVALASGTASATGTFVNGTSPTGTSANFLYSGGVLRFDPDGTGGQAAVTIANLSGNPSLTSTRISVIA
jgi:lysophospholipase L1-like esterase